MMKIYKKNPNQNKKKQWRLNRERGQRSSDRPRKPTGVWCLGLVAEKHPQVEDGWETFSPRLCIRIICAFDLHVFFEEGRDCQK